MTNYQRYQILSTFDIAKIQRDLGEQYNNLAEVNRAASEAYARLSATEKATDYADATATLAKGEKQ